MDSKQAILPEFQCPKKYIGNYLSRIASVRKTAVSTIRGNGQAFGDNYKYCQIGHRFDGCDNDDDGCYDDDGCGGVVEFVGDLVGH